MQTNIELAKARDFGEIINDTFTFIRQNFKPLVKYFFIFCGFFMLAEAAILVLLKIRVLAFANSITPGGFQEDYFSRFYSLLGGYFLVFIFILLEYTAIKVTVLCYMALYKQKQNTPPTSEEMWGYFKYFFLRILWCDFVLGLLTVAGLVFCLLPGIYLGTIFALVAPIMIVENGSFGYGFNQSFRLIKDNWWATFGVIIVVYIILYVVNLIVAIPAAILGAGNFFLHLSDGVALSLPIAILTTVLETVAHVFQILLIVAIGFCYFNLTETKEGTGLMERMNQFGSSAPAADSTPEEY
ncbi:MAG TPA: hypothetical protein VHC47_13630 [Mucilaginibacter sp.]|nr:hypothetical protein [Mucilaginibacter sp.]